MILQDWWFTTLLAQQYAVAPPLMSDINADVLIIGGGMSGVSAAASFIGSGLTVVLLERNILGGSSTGRSAGFLTPDSELELSQLIRRYGPKGAKEIWEVPCRGIDLIRKCAADFGIDCDLQTQDSLFLGLGTSGAEDTQAEAETRAKLDLKSTVYKDSSELGTVFGGQGYSAGTRYSETYGINALQCVQGMKRALIDAGIVIHESTEVRSLDGHKAITHAGSVTADQIIIAMDKMTNDFDPIAKEVFHAQTFLSISEPLSDAEVREMFPSGDRFQCWDSNVMYTYYRLTGDQRLLLGGGSFATTYLPTYFDNPHVIKGVVKGFKQHFPFLADLNIIQFWPGMIDSTRDLLPIIVRDPKAPYRHFVQGCVGLPWASFSGDFVGRAIQGKCDADEKRYYEYFSDRRHFLFPTWIERVIGKPITFALNNAYAKYRQVDIGKKPKFSAIDF